MHNYTRKQDNEHILAIIVSTMRHKSICELLNTLEYWSMFSRKSINIHIILSNFISSQMRELSEKNNFNGNTLYFVSP